MKLHKLLLRQLHRLGIENGTQAPSQDQWQRFIECINKTYVEADEERYMLERSMEISSRELHQLNEKLEAAQHIAQLGYWHYDRNNEHIVWSKELYAIFGLNPANPPPTYKEFLDMVHEQERSQLYTLVEQSLSEQVKNEYEMRVLNSDGKYRWYYLIISPMNEPNVLAGIAMDITKRKQAEIEIKALHQKLLTTARSAGMSEIATSTLHNVGNILNSAYVSISMIKENINPPHYQNLFQAIKMMNKNIDSLQDYLVNDPKGKLIPNYLVQVSGAIENEHNVIITEVVNLYQHLQHIKDIVAVQQTLSGVSGVSEKVFLPELIETAIQMSGNTFEDDNVTLVKSIEKSSFILIDKSKLLQIMVNLIKNARDSVLLNKAASFKEMALTVKESDPQTVMISVTDNGVGIAPENLAKIFGFGFTTKIDGHGFGLHSSALAAKEMGGTLFAESEGLGLGATFTLKLPLNGIKEGQREEL